MGRPRFVVDRGGVFMREKGGPQPLPSLLCCFISDVREAYAHRGRGLRSALPSLAVVFSACVFRGYDNQ